MECANEVCKTKCNQATQDEQSCNLSWSWFTFLHEQKDAGNMSGAGTGNRNPPFRPVPPRGGVPQQRAMPFSSGLHQPSPGRDDVIKGTDDDAIISKL